MGRPLTKNFQNGREPLSLVEYQKAGGYVALKKVLHDMAPQAVIGMVAASNLRGPRRSGIPHGYQVGVNTPGPSLFIAEYFVVDADEMEPGTFKDRSHGGRPQPAY